MLPTLPAPPSPRDPSESDQATGPNYLRLAALGLAAALAVFTGLPYVLRLFNPAAGSFDTGTINVLALAALEYVAAGHLALLTYKRLLPSFYDELRTCLQEKLLENVTGELTADLLHPESVANGLLPLLTERRKLLQFKFLIRCARLLICLLPLLFFFGLALYVLSQALTVVPK